MLEANDGFVRHVDRRSGTAKHEAEVLDFTARDDATLLKVYHQAKMGSQITSNRGEHTLGTATRLRKDHKVVCVAHERQASSLQFLVQVI